MFVRLGITLGDVTGVGPEVTVKALASAVTEFPETQFVVLGDRGWLDRHVPPSATPVRPWTPLDAGPGLVVFDPRAQPLPAVLPSGAAESARAALDWLREGARRCLGGELAALVTAPVNKAAIMAAGERFVGQTEFLSALAGTDRTVMMLLGSDDRGRWLRVALVTTHLPLAAVAAAITPAKVALAIQRAADACRALALPRARIAVCGLNPHAGEDGRLGREESMVIGPAIRTAQSQGMDVTGPWPADTLFHQAYRGECEVIVAMYHDQGLPALKMVAFDQGVNWTLGLPFIRTSPDHGTAYDIAGRGVADPGSMLAAVRLAHTLATQQNTAKRPPVAG